MGQIFSKQRYRKMVFSNRAFIPEELEQLENWIPAFAHRYQFRSDLYEQHHRS